MANERSFELFEMIAALGKAQLIQVAATLRIADHLRGGPKTCAELAVLCDCHQQSLGRALRALASLGVFEDAGGGRYRQTGLSECLISDAPGSFQPLARYFAHPACWRPWGELLHSVKTGQPAFRRVFELDAWEYRAMDPELNAIFNGTMRAFASEAKAAITSVYDFSGVQRLIDVGGGEGTLIAEILAAHPKARGVLLDLPHVVAGAPAVLEGKGVADRCEVAAGDFFQELPSGGDLYLLRAILHNWDDEPALAILSGCRRAIAPLGKLVIVDPGVAEAEGFRRYFLDLQMLLMLGGRERTRDELDALCARAGFRVTVFKKLAGGDVLLEAAPA